MHPTDDDVLSRDLNVAMGRPRKGYVEGFAGVQGSTVVALRGHLRPCPAVELSPGTTRSGPGGTRRSMDRRVAEHQGLMELGGIRPIAEPQVP